MRKGHLPRQEEQFLTSSNSTSTDIFLVGGITHVTKLASTESTWEVNTHSMQGELFGIDGMDITTP